MWRLKEELGMLELVGVSRFMKAAYLSRSDDPYERHKRNPMHDHDVGKGKTLRVS